MADRPQPEEEVRRLYEQAEQATAGAMEDLVSRDAFGELLARVTENVMAVAKIGFDVLDLTVRNLRIAGRQDVVRLGRQLARTEDKLELVLQEVERLGDEVRARQDTASRRGGAASAGRGSRSGGSSANGGRRGGRRAGSGSNSGSGSRSASRSGSGSRSS